MLVTEEKLLTCSKVDMALFILAARSCAPGLPFCLPQDNTSEMVGQVDNCVHWLYIHKYSVFDKVTTGSAFKLWFSEFISYV